MANWNYLRNGLADLGEVFDFSLPTHAAGWNRAGSSGTISEFLWSSSRCRANCSWFGFMLRIRPSSNIRRVDVVKALEQKRIGSRMLFGGNLLRQPLFIQLKQERSHAIREVGEFKGADELMHSALFLGTFPGLSKSMLDLELDTIRKSVAAN